MSYTPYATATQLKDYLQDYNNDFDRDDYLYDDLVVEASRAIDSYTHRSFQVPSTVTTRTYTLARNGLYIDGLDDIAVTTGLTVSIDGSGSGVYTTNTQWHTETDYETGRVSAIRFSVRQSAGCVAPNVQVTARFGWPAVPPEVHRACLLKAARLYNRKDSPTGVLGFNNIGAVRLSSEDADVRSLLTPYVAISRELA